MNDELMHHGIKGQKWGVRRYQNEDGSLTKEGKERLQNRIDNHDIRDKKARKVGRVSLVSMPVSIGLTAVGAMLGGPLGSAAILAGSSTFLAEKYAALASVGARIVNNKLANDAVNDLIDDELLKHGEEWDDHKYIDKVKTKNGYRYVYDKPKSIDKKANLSGIQKTQSTTDAANKENRKGAVLATLLNTKRVISDSFGNVKDYASGKKVSKVEKLNKKNNASKTGTIYSSAVEDVQKINPNYEAGNEDYCENCSFCTATYDLRRRDYDVTADNHEDFTATTINEQLEWYDGAKLVDCADMLQDIVGKTDEDLAIYIDNKFAPGDSVTYADLYRAVLDDSLIAQGEGARGFIDLFWANGGGHAIAYEVFKHPTTGELIPTYFDTQLNKKVDTAFTTDYLGNIAPGQFGYIRTDNVEPTDKITKTCKNR